MPMVKTASRVVRYVKGTLEPHSDDGDDDELPDAWGDNERDEDTYQCQQCGSMDVSVTNTELALNDPDVDTAYRHGTNHCADCGSNYLILSPGESR